jgi:hypothetical protein
VRRRCGRIGCLAIALAAVASAVLPAGAPAAPFPPSLKFAYRLAVEHWGEEPSACRSIDRQIVPPGSLGNPQIGAISGMSSYVAPDAAPRSIDCFLWIDRAYAEPIIFDLLCAVMLHHVGHLLGMEDSPDPHSVMNERIPVPGTCRAKGRQSARLYLLRLKFHWLQTRQGVRPARLRHRVLREMRREAARFWAIP